VPFPLGELGGGNTSLGELQSSGGSFGGLALTSLAAIAALLGGFYEADNTPADEAPGEGPRLDAKPAGTKRIAAPAALDDLEDELEDAPPRKQSKK
jgi:hypothetical protein